MFNHFLYCILLQHDPILSDEVFGLTEDTITFPDTKLESTSTYKFNDVFNGFRDLHNAFEKSYSPIIRNVLNGENAMLIFGGTPVSESLDFFTSMNGRVGLINHAAQILLKTNTVSSATSNNTITLSWYRIDNKGSESITDLLRMSSSLHSEKPESNLVLRELGKGKGMAVPGLWEVEITKPQDVDAVIAHVQKMAPIAKHDGQAHSIFQLIVSPNDSFEEEAKKTSSKHGVIKEDAPGVGRLTFVLLSNISSPPLSDASGNGFQRFDLYPWVHQLEDVLKWIDSKRPSPPFHKSRILLLLRDALCSRMACGVSLFLQPTVEALSVNAIWLQLISHIAAMSAERSTAISSLPSHPPVAVAPVLSAAGGNSVPMTHEQALHFNASSGNKPHSTPSSSRVKPPFNASVNPNSSRRPFSGKKTTEKHKNVANKSHSRDERAAHTANHYRPDQQRSNNVQNDDHFMRSQDIDRHLQHSGHPKSPPQPPSPEEIRQQQLYLHQLKYQQQFYDQAAHPPPPKTGLRHQHSLHSKEKEFLSPPPPPSHSYPLEDDNGAVYSSSFLPPQLHQSHQHAQGEEKGNEHGSDRSDDREAETVQALLQSLESSREEVNSLKESLHLAQQSLEHYKHEYETLKSAQVKEGQTLKAKDRERFKKALQELKDYEVYREVMEAAMSRMQNEIDKLEGDSSSHKQLANQLEKELRKSKNIANKITRETADFEKAKVTLHERVQTAEKEAKRLSKERDAAVLALSQYKAEKARDEEDLKNSRRVKHKEVLELKKKLTDMQVQLKEVNEESDAAAQRHNQEMKRLQAAHKKSLEMLMTCQEENDLLRNTVSELEKGSTQPDERQPSRSSAVSNLFQREEELSTHSSEGNKLETAQNSMNDDEENKDQQIEDESEIENFSP